MNYKETLVGWQSELGDERITYSQTADGEILICREFFDPESGWAIDDSFELTSYQWDTLVAAIAEWKGAPKLQFCGGVREV
jgi:hypothetical protein